MFHACVVTVLFFTGGGVTLCGVAPCVGVLVTNQPFVSIASIADCCIPQVLAVAIAHCILASSGFNAGAGAPTHH